MPPRKQLRGRTKGGLSGMRMQSSKYQAVDYCEGGGASKMSPRNGVNICVDISQPGYPETDQGHQAKILVGHSALSQLSELVKRTNGWHML